jgi:uncharacterized membrane protein YdjX (TVP38/TMEM64 family)
MKAPAARGDKMLAIIRLAVLPAIVLIAVLVAWKLGYFEMDRRQSLLATVQRLRMVHLIQIWFVLAYAILITLCIPATVATLLGGAVFGSWKGALLAWVACLIGTVLSHWLARSVARKPIQRLFGEHKLMRQLKEQDGVMPLIKLRVIPVAPFAVLGYIAGIAGVSLQRLLLATAIAMIPSVYAYSYVGAELITGMTSADDASKRALWIAGAVTVTMLVVSLIPGIYRRLRGRKSA